MDILHRTVSTVAGPLRVVVPDAEFLERVQGWPKPVVALGRDEPPGWGLSFYDGAGPLLGARVGFGYTEREALARDAHEAQRLLIPAALAEFRRLAPDATVLAAAHRRASGRFWQAGLAVFVAAGRPPAAPRHPERHYDGALGPGGTDALLTLLECAARAWDGAGLPPRELTDLDLVPFDDCGALGFDLLLAGGAIAWLRDELDGESELVREIVRAGIPEVYDFPAIPLRLPGDVPLIP